MENQEVKLDLRDKKILYHLDFHARMSYSELAKKVGLSKQGAEYKVNRLVEKGVIKGFYPVINVPRMGYSHCRVMLVLRNVTEEKEKEIIDYLVNDPRWFWVFTVQGVVDILCGMWGRNMLEFKEAVNDLLSKYGRYIRSKTETVATDVIHYQHRYLLNEKRTEEINTRITTEHVKIDTNDEAILKQLCRDARMPIVKIAEKVDMSQKVVSYRIKRLEKEQIIQGYRPIIDHNKLGYTYYKILININYDDMAEIKRLYAYIKDDPIVLYVVKGVCFPEDIDLELMVKDNQELTRFIRDLKFKFSTLIGNYKMFMFIDTKKVRYLPYGL